LISYAEIPDRVLEALGDWRKCTFRDANNLLKATRNPSTQAVMLDAAERLIAGDPQLGFHVRLIVLLGQKPTASAGTEGVRDDSGRVVAVRKRSKRATAIAFAADLGEGLADFVWTKMPVLIEEYRRQQADRS
jgi:hypothetical protein